MIEPTADAAAVFFQSLEPAHGTTLWRYMDFTRYVALLDSSSLYFTRADQFQDPFEGSHSRLNEQMRPKIYENIPPAVLIHMSKMSRAARGWTYVSCWHASEHESAAMWSAYAPVQGSIAVQTTYERLRSQVSPEVKIGRVRYIDYEKNWSPEGNLYYPFFHKRLSFDHEREVRAVFLDAELPPGEEINTDELQENPKKGQLRAVSLAELVQSVRVAPTAADWILHLVERVTLRYGFTFPIQRSALDAPPTY